MESHSKPKTLNSTGNILIYFQNEIFQFYQTSVALKLMRNILKCVLSPQQKRLKIYTYVSGPKLFFGRGDGEFKHSPKCCPLVQVATRYVYQNGSTTR